MNSGSSWEMSRIPWRNLRSAGNSDDVPKAIEALQAAPDEESALKAYWKIDNVVIVQGALYEAAEPAARCLLQCLLRCSSAARRHVLELLVQLGSGEPSEVELRSGNSALAARCRAEVARGYHLYANLLESSDAREEHALCIDLLGLCCLVDRKLRDSVLWYFGCVRTRGASDGVLQLIASWEGELRDSQ